MRKWPDVASLELLVCVADTGSVGKAATACGITQASASRRLDTLEHELGLSLLIRTPAGSRLTTQGEVVVAWARKTIDAATDLMTGASALRRHNVTALKAAASMTVAEYLMPRWLMALRHAKPQVDVSLHVANSHTVAEMVRDGRVDIGFIESPVSPRDLRSRRVAVDRLAVVVAPRHPWARRSRPVGADDLASTPLVVREPGSGTRAALEHVLGADRMCEPLVELASNAAVKVLVQTGAGPAVLSELATDNEVRDGRLVAVQTRDLDLSRVLCAIWRRNARLGEPARALMAVTGRDVPRQG